MPNKNSMKVDICKNDLYKIYILEHLSTRDIAKRLCVAQKTIINWLNKYNIKKDKNQWIKERQPKIEHTLFKKGHKVPDKWKEISRKAHSGLACHITPHSEETKEKLRKSQIKRLSSGRFSTKETLPEKMVREELIKRKIKFISQYPYKKGIADFYIPQYNAVIECDGDYWHNYPTGTQKDLLQTVFLVSNGYKVYRFWEKEIMESVKKCIEQIK